MPGQRRWGSLALAAALSSLVGCATYDSVDVGVTAGDSPGYELGGQTGSLVPGCGLAPLSAEGARVPTGAALAILYARDCQAALAQNSLALSGADASDVMLTLVPLEGDGVYLVQADRRVINGDYALSIGMDASSVSVGNPIALPERVGTLTAEPSAEGCEEAIRFQMTDRATLAYAPIARFTVSIDDGEEQLWVDYGALPVSVAAEGSSAEFVLPRCGLTSCLPQGHHQLVLRMDVAGVDTQPAASGLDFEVHCPLPEPEPGAPSDSDPGCNLTVPPSRPPATVFALLLAALLRRRLSRRAQRS